MIPRPPKTLFLKQILLLLGMSAGTFWLGSRLLSPPTLSEDPRRVAVANAATVSPASAPTRADQPLPPRIDAVDSSPPPAAPQPFQPAQAIHVKSRAQAQVRLNRPIVPVHAALQQHDNGLHRGWYKHDKRHEEEGGQDEGDKHSERDDEHGGEGD